MSYTRILLGIVLLAAVIGIVLWVDLDAVMRGVTEAERNMGGARQAVKDDRVPERNK